MRDTRRGPKATGAVCVKAQRMAVVLLVGRGAAVSFLDVKVLTRRCDWRSMNLTNLKAQALTLVVTGLLVLVGPMLPIGSSADAALVTYEVDFYQTYLQNISNVCGNFCIYPPNVTTVGTPSIPPPHAPAPFSQSSRIVVDDSLLDRPIPFSGLTAFSFFTPGLSFLIPLSSDTPFLVRPGSGVIYLASSGPGSFISDYLDYSGLRGGAELAKLAFDDFSAVNILAGYDVPCFGGSAEQCLPAFPPSPGQYVPCPNFSLGLECNPWPTPGLPLSGGPGLFVQVESDGISSRSIVFGTYTIERVSPLQVPQPSPLFLLGSGLVWLAGTAAWRRRKQ
jgi:hypothetical protein